MKNLVIAGNVGKDAIIRTTQNGKKVASWPVAVDDGWGDNKTTMWFDCSLWGQRGEKMAQYITQGSKITVSGELSKREHEGKTYFTLNASDVALQGGKSGEQGGGYSQDQGGYQQILQPAPSDLDSEIPF